MHVIARTIEPLEGMCQYVMRAIMPKTNEISWETRSFAGTAIDKLPL